MSRHQTERNQFNRRIKPDSRFAPLPHEGEVRNEEEPCLTTPKDACGVLERFSRSSKQVLSGTENVGSVFRIMRRAEDAPAVAAAAPARRPPATAATLKHVIVGADGKPLPPSPARDRSRSRSRSRSRGRRRDRSRSRDRRRGRRRRDDDDRRERRRGDEDRRERSRSRRQDGGGRRDDEDVAGLVGGFWRRRWVGHQVSVVSAATAGSSRRSGSAISSAIFARCAAVGTFAPRVRCVAARGGV